MLEDKTVINIKDTNKKYKVYNRKRDRLVETCLPFIKKHNTFIAIDNLNLEIKKGEVLGILGRNGAGKSTLLKMITGVVAPTNGTINIDGKISSLLELGTAFNLEFTGYENIYQHGQIFGYTREQIKEREREIIKFADIGDHLNQPVKTYSSGMFARLAFACAINVDPDILIVDEVLSVGDLAFQLKCFKKFEEFKERNKTILFVTHNINDILKNCSRTLIIEKGKKIFDGNTKDGVEQYKKLITGMLHTEEEIEEKVKNDNKYDETNNDEDINKIWKTNFTLNDNIIKYGNKGAEVIDYGIFNLNGEPQPIVNNNEEVCVKMKVKFYKTIEKPTFSITIKDFNGRELCGTNTNLHNIDTGIYNTGDIAICEFKQKLQLAPGRYTLSISCSRYDEQGELIVIDRNYDALIFEVISKINVVGEFNLDTKINFKKV